MSPNTMRGEVEIRIDGQLHQLRFTLGALRELKDHFNARSIAEIFKNANDWGPEDIVQLFAAGLRRGSMPGVQIAELEDMMVLQDLPSYAEALSQAFNAANTGSTDQPEAKEPADADPTTPTQSPSTSARES